MQTTTTHTKTRLAKIAALALVALAAAVAASPAAASATPGTYSHTDPAVQCHVDYNASGQVVSRSITVDAPVMATARSQQLASYQVFVFHWNGSSWVYDSRLDAIGGNVNWFGYTAETGGAMPSNNGFDVNTGGYYRISIKYQWYWNNTVEKSDYAWAGGETQVFTKPGYMPWYGTTGDWCYIK